MKRLLINAHCSGAYTDTHTHTHTHIARAIYTDPDLGADLLAHHHVNFAIIARHGAAGCSGTGQVYSVLILQRSHMHTHTHTQTHTHTYAHITTAKLLTHTHTQLGIVRHKHICIQTYPKEARCPYAVIYSSMQVGYCNNSYMPLTAPGISYSARQLV